jgi:hypothetical protein
MMRRKFGTKRGLCRQPIDLQKKSQELAFKWIYHANLCIHDFLFFQCSMSPQIYYDQTNCKWVHANSILLNMIMEYDPIRKFYLLDHVDAKSLDHFFGKKNLIIRIALLLITLEHLPLVENLVGNFILCIQ